MPIPSVIEQLANMFPRPKLSDAPPLQNVTNAAPVLSISDPVSLPPRAEIREEYAQSLVDVNATSDRARAPIRPKMCWRLYTLPLTLLLLCLLVCSLPSKHRLSAGIVLLVVLCVVAGLFFRRSYTDDDDQTEH